jgi:hypothetical protein
MRAMFPELLAGIAFPGVAAPCFDSAHCNAERQLLKTSKNKQSRVRRNERFIIN